MKRGKQKSKKFIATVEESKMNKIHQIAKSMEEDGVQVDQVLSLSGIITGTAPDLEALNKFKSKGINTIEEDREARAL